MNKIMLEVNKDSQTITLLLDGVKYEQKIIANKYGAYSVNKFDFEDVPDIDDDLLYALSDVNSAGFSSMMALRYLEE